MCQDTLTCSKPWSPWLQMCVRRVVGRQGGVLCLAGILPTPCTCCVCGPQLLSQVAVPVESSRAKRSLSRDAVFTSNAGKLKSEDAKVDSNGNVLGPDGELGRKGAFKGLKVVIIQQYSFDFSNPRRALEVSVHRDCAVGVLLLLRSAPPPNQGVACW
jgi:hypothetical protein